MKLSKLFTLSTLVACGLSLASCGGNNDSSSISSSSEEAKSSPTSTEVVEEKKVNVGMGYNVSLSDGQIDVTAAMVAFNTKTGVIEGARIDVVQVKYEANEAKDGLQLTAKCVTREDYKVKTKLELGKDYNMVTYGGAVAEVDAQLESYADWCVGHTASEVSSSLVARDGAHYEGALYTADDTLWSSVTITVNKLADAVAKAYTNKSAVEYTWTDTSEVGVGINGGVAYNYGKPSKELSVDLAGAIVDDGKITAAAIDAVVCSFNIAEDGAISVDTTAKYHAGSTAENTVVLSKKDLKDAYAMSSSSPIGKEWYEQAAAFEADVVGHTAAEISADGFELAGCTITSSSYISALVRAAEYATLDHVGPQA